VELYGERLFYIKREKRNAGHRVVAFRDLYSARLAKSATKIGESVTC
jgi:hypothetical protein